MTSEERDTLGREILEREVMASIARGEGYPLWINATSRVEFSDDGSRAWIYTTMQSNAPMWGYDVSVAPKKKRAR